MRAREQLEARNRDIYPIDKKDKSILLTYTNLAVLHVLCPALNESRHRRSEKLRRDDTFVSFMQKDRKVNLS